MKKLIMIALLLAGIASVASAAVLEATFGNKSSNGLYRVQAYNDNSLVQSGVQVEPIVSYTAPATTGSTVTLDLLAGQVFSVSTATTTATKISATNIPATGFAEPIVLLISNGNTTVNTIVTFDAAQFKVTSSNTLNTGTTANKIATMQLISDGSSIDLISNVTTL